VSALAFGAAAWETQLGGHASPHAALAAGSDTHFVSRPDLRLPHLVVLTSVAGVHDDSLILLAPYNAPLPAPAGTMIVDRTGEVIWEQSLPNLVGTDLRVQTFAGRPALTWWQGLVEFGHGVGEYVVADENYAPVAHVRAGAGLNGDLHEFLLTDRGTALLTSYVMTLHDLRPAGGSSSGAVQDAVVQELDIETGKVLFEWHSLDHIPVTDSYSGVYTWWDYAHINSIAVDSDGNLLVSARNTHTIYKVDRTTGNVIWRLGGKRSDFAIEDAAMFAWQHDARRQPDGTITLFDNGATVSRALMLSVDERRRRVQLVREYRHPHDLLSTSQGNMQVLPNGNVFVGWGGQPYISEFSADGELLYDARIGNGQITPAGLGYISYRAYRMPWTGRGIGAPAIAARHIGRHKIVYVSWNGDTRVTHWNALAGTDAGHLASIGSVPRTGFETAIRVPRSFTHLQVQGVSSTNAVLTRTSPITI
jgi:outer membrane protein assembly factor BamB